MSMYFLVQYLCRCFSPIYTYSTFSLCFFEAFLACQSERYPQANLITKPNLKKIMFGFCTHLLGSDVAPLYEKDTSPAPNLVIIKLQIRNKTTPFKKGWGDGIHSSF